MRADGFNRPLLHPLCFLAQLEVQAREMYNLPCAYIIIIISSHSSNLSCSAILSDVTTPANRARALSHVGIAFAICFCIGPPIGAYFATRPAPLTFAGRELNLNVYAAPAILTLILLTLECIFLIAFLPETRGKKLAVDKGKQANGKAAETNARKADVPTRISLLASLRQLHFLFLGLFSGE